MTRINMRNESWLDIRILKTPEVEQPENLERIQDNPNQPKVQGIIEESAKTKISVIEGGIVRGCFSWVILIQRNPRNCNERIGAFRIIAFISKHCLAVR